MACANDIKIVGGDITGSEKIMISVCAIGKTKHRNISSRKNARVGQKVIVSGVHGSSSAGLRLLSKMKALSGIELNSIQKVYFAGDVLPIH